MKKLLGLMSVLVICIACKHKPMKVNIDAREKLEAFKKKKKLVLETTGLQYQGLSVPKNQSELNTLLNKAADDFIETLQTDPTEQKFQGVIKLGLARFNPYHLDLDTEDREKICHYFEELMDAVGLESSGGELNNWMYDFDPNQKS